MKVTQSEVAEFKKLNDLVRAGKATPEETARAKELAMKMKGKGKRGNFNHKKGNPGTNDVSWYKKYPDLIKDSANVIFNEIAGTKFEAPVKGIASDVPYPVVGARFIVLPTIGKSTLATDPFNYQMRDLWLQLHRAYRGIGTYEYADLGIAMFSIMMAFADIARAERIYGIASKFVARNRSYPSVILEALGLDANSMDAAQLADFRYQLNRVIEKAEMLCLPKGFSAFDLYITLFGNVYKDAENVRAQWYFYDSLYRIDYDPTFTTGSSVVYTPRTMTDASGTKQSLQDIISDLNYQIDQLLSDTDIARICSDLLKAFGDNGVQKLVSVPEDFKIEPIKDEIRQLQLHNTRLCGNVAGGNFSAAILTALGSFTSDYDTLRIYQENGVIKQSLFVNSDILATHSLTPSNYHLVGPAGNQVNVPATGYSAQFIDGDVALDTWEDDPSEDAIVEMTRQAVSFTHDTITSGGNTYEIVSLDSYQIYVVCFMQMFCADPTGFAKMAYGANAYWYTSIITANYAAAISASLTKLDWAPEMRIGYYNSGNVALEYSCWDIDNYSLISKTALHRLHDACTLSLFKLSLAPSGQNN